MTDVTTVINRVLEELGKEGFFITLSDILEKGDTLKVVLPGGVNIRKKADFNSDKTGYLAQGDTFKVLDVVKDGLLMNWYKIEHGYIKVESDFYVRG